MHYELWHVPSGNLVNTYPSEEEALAPVLRALRTHGKEHAESFALGREDRHGRSTLIAEGAELLERALAAVGMTGAMATELSSDLK